MKICLLGASFETDNMGVSALTAGLVACTLNTWPEAEISLFEYEKHGKVIEFPYANSAIPIRLVNIRFSKTFWLKNNIARLMLEALIARMIPFEGIRRAWVRRNEWLAHIDGMDLVAAISGGDSFSDIYGLVRFIYTCLPQALALLMRKRLVLLPQTLGPFKSRFAWLVARAIVSQAQVVYSRDSAGVELAQRLSARTPKPREEAGPAEHGEKVRFCYDVAFVLDAVPPSRVDVAGLATDCLWREDERARPLVGVNVSGLLLMAGPSRVNAFGLKMAYGDFISNLVDFFVREKDADVLLIPHVFGNDGESDPPACEAVYEALKAKHPGRIGWLRGSYNQSEIKYVIGRCVFLVGSRMHACIAAVSQCVPAVSVAYSDKFIGVMETIGIDDLVADPRKMKEQEILDLVDHAYEHRAIISHELEQQIPQAKKRVLALFAEMTAEAESVPSAPFAAPVAGALRRR